MQGYSNPNRGLSFSHYSRGDPKNSRIFQNNLPKSIQKYGIQIHVFAPRIAVNPLTFNMGP